MRIVVLGGTKFIGRAISARLLRNGHDVLVVHRGDTEPEDLASARHLHVDRADLPRKRADVEAFQPDGAVEVYAMNAGDTSAALRALPDGIRLVAISSGDVYRAYDGLHSGRVTDAVPLVETSPLRDRLYVDGSKFENLEVEPPYLQRGAAVLRLGAVFGPHDYQRRFEFVLRRLRAGRDRIPIGSGQFLFSKVYVEDVAAAVELALTTDAARGEAFNLVERDTAPYGLFARQILQAADSDAELVPVADSQLPKDLALTGVQSQHLLMDSTKARTVLGWEPTDRTEALATSVAWHLAHPPAVWDPDFAADDRAMKGR
jgi:nucleoside-diphosphate-sugar epimerase